MEKYYLNAPSHTEEAKLDSLMAEMVLDKALRDFQKERILKEIDDSLSSNNKESFLRLTNELQQYLD